MTKLTTIQIDPTPANVLAMCQRGQFHSHQDGAWRYSPFGGETVYCNDPSERFPLAGTFANGWAAKADPESGLMARIYGDGTCGLELWDDSLQYRVGHLYAPRHEGERQQRKWLATQFKASWAETV